MLWPIRFSPAMETPIEFPFKCSLCVAQKARCARKHRADIPSMVARSGGTIFSRICYPDLAVSLKIGPNSIFLTYNAPKKKKLRILALNKHLLITKISLGIIFSKLKQVTIWLEGQLLML